MSTPEAGAALLLRFPRRWPLLLVAPASCVAVWSGWVGLGEMTGFGPVHPLPGIWDAFQVNTAITLPIGVEAYAAYALNAALSPARLTPRTRRFAWASAVGSLMLGGAGQIAYHLLKAAGQTSAPWPVTTLVSVLPVLVLGMAAALAHMIAADRAAESSRGSQSSPAGESTGSTRAEPVPVDPAPAGQSSRPPESRSEAGPGPAPVEPARVDPGSGSAIEPTESTRVEAAHAGQSSRDAGSTGLAPGGDGRAHESGESTSTRTGGPAPVEPTESTRVEAGPAVESSPVVDPAPAGQSSRPPESRSEAGPGPAPVEPARVDSGRGRIVRPVDLDELGQRLAAAIEAGEVDPRTGDPVNPESAESIRRTLGIGAGAARRLRQVNGSG